MSSFTNEFLQDGNTVNAQLVGNPTASADTFTLHTETFASDLDVSLELNIKLGSGDDLAVLDFSDVSTIDSISLALDGGTGNDRAVIDFSGVANLETAFKTVGNTVVGTGYSFNFDAGAGVVDGDVSLKNFESFKVKGTVGDDVLFGGTGDDWLDGWVGADTLLGSAGNDSYVFGDSGDVVVGEKVGGGTDTIWSTVSVDLRDQGVIENLRLWGQDDLKATGNSLQNLITGNAGDNVITGGVSYDKLYGKGGADTFVYAEMGPGNRDLIVDFDSDDKIALSKHVFLDLGGLTSKTLDADHFALNAATADHAQIIYNEETGMLSYDVDGTGSAVASEIVRIEKNAAYFGHDDIVFV